ncbi:hypothetical protein MMC11_004839 [Xylographa trunciseda]|nr:hypothetical protein [Xylographa trunciseda]
MSSNNDDFFDPRTLCSPTPSDRGNSGGGDSQDVSVRRMGLKVLYTFDDQNKTNCLARWPQVINIRTAYLDETTQVGVIELKTCIQAIVTASPELVAKLAHDYTVYAYDYSEYEIPLVGQGMLSWILASSSTTPSAPASQSRTMVTGRVCKNLIALFSNGVQETLEVKLRLVPVPTSLQSEYLESMRKYRDLSKIMPEGFDSQAWTNFLQANPGMLSVGEQSRSQSPIVNGGQRDVGIEHVQRLFNEGYGSQNARLQDYQNRRDNYSDTIEAQNEVPSGSSLPHTLSSTSQTAPRQSHQRPDSRASVRGEENESYSRRQSIDPGYMSSDDRFEEPAKKRAKVTKAEWPNKNYFAKGPESLRVAASTAASVRVFQPTAVRPSGSAPNALEEPPRAPTPIPAAANRQLRPPIPAVRSGLGRMSLSMTTSEYTSPYVSSDPVQPPESAMTSPEENHSNYAPCDPASSPPVMHGASPTPSSPILPPLPRLPESACTAGVIDGVFENDDDEGNQILRQLDLDIVADYNKRPEPKVSEPKPRKAAKKKALESNLTQQEKNEKAAAWSRRQARNASGSKALSRTASSGNLKQAAAPASDPIRPSHGTLQRSHTWSGQQAPHPASDMPMGSEGVEAPRPRSRAGWNNAKRKQAIQSKLATSIAAGEMPPFCENCGAIETPTWRKAFSKVHCGGMELVQLSDDEGGILACVTLETNEDGTTKLFKIIKKTLLKTDKDFTEILLCNPCGLWLHNHKCPRPESVWKQRKDDNSRKEGGERRKKSATADPSSDARWGASNMPSDASSPMDGIDDDPVPVEPEQDDEPQLPPVNRKRAMSAQMASGKQTKSDIAIGNTAVAALQRAIQSSPGRFLGTKHVPIEVDDLTPKPTRRVLFPSPKHQTVVGLGGCDDIPEVNSSQRGSPATAKTLIATVDTTDKENCPPAEPAQDPFDDLFDEAPKPMSCPPSPSPSSRLPSHIFKTPTKSPAKHVFTTGDFFSSAAKAFLHAPRTPSRTPNKEALGEMTPFTRHLSQMLSDANGGDSPSHFTPSKAMDFLSLPPLENSADVSSTPGRYFRSEDFEFGTMCSEGIGMPSSPPGAWFGVYEDPKEACGTGWAPLEFGSSPLKVGGVMETGKPAEQTVTVKTEDEAREGV